MKPRTKVNSIPVVKVIELGQGHPLQAWLVDLLIGQSVQEEDPGVRTHSVRPLGVVLLQGGLVELDKTVNKIH